MVDTTDYHDNYTLAPDIVYTKQLLVTQTLAKDSFCVVPCAPYLREVICSRSSLWEGMRNRTVATTPYCVICGKNKNLQVHHIRPFHLWPELELTPENLVVLCQACHLTWGHLGDWKSFNLDVEKDIERIRNRPYQRI
jgi:hypothetical protein